VEYEFTPAGELGIVEKEILIRTNDPASQTRKVKLIADIREFLRPIGGSNMITIIENAVLRKPVTKLISMKNVSGFPVTIRGDSISTPSVTISMENTRLLPNDTLNVRITVVPETPGLSLETVYLLTDHKSIPRVEIKLTIFGTQGN
jgi:hypothetical protein